MLTESKTTKHTGKVKSEITKSINEQKCWLKNTVLKNSKAELVTAVAVAQRSLFKSKFQNHKNTTSFSDL